MRVVYTRLNMPRAKAIGWRKRLLVNAGRIRSDDQKLGWYVRFGSTGYARYRLPQASSLRAELEFYRGEVDRMNRELAGLRSEHHELAALRAAAKRAKWHEAQPVEVAER